MKEDSISKEILYNLNHLKGKQLIDFVSQIRKTLGFSPIYFWVVVSRSCETNNQAFSLQAYYTLQKIELELVISKTGKP